MEIHNLGETSSLFNSFMSEIRDEKIQQDALRFRRNLERVGEIMAYEISKTFEHSIQEVTTPLGVAKVDNPDLKPVLATVLRAGLPFHNGFLNYFDSSENTFICAHRKVTGKNDFEIAFEYISSPDLTGKTIILSAYCFLRLFNESGPNLDANGCVIIKSTDSRSLKISFCLFESFINVCTACTS